MKPLKLELWTFDDIKELTITQDFFQMKNKRIKLNWNNQEFQREMDLEVCLHLRQILKLNKLINKIIFKEIY